MIRLDATTRKLQIVLAGAITTSQLPVTVCYSDKTVGDYLGAAQLATTNSTTAVDICAAPATSTVRDIDTIDVQNADTAAATVTIRYNDNATLYTLFRATLAIGDQLTYVHGLGWRVLDSLGNVKTAASGIVASAVASNPSGALAATNVQTALDELEAEKQPLSSILSGVAAGTTVLGMKNIIINGNFSINQRAYVSGATVGANLYGHDRWKMAASGDTYTFSTTLNVTTITIPSGKVLQQVVEGLNLQSGTYTLSWTGTAQGKIGTGSYGASGLTGTATGGTDLTIEFGPGTVSRVQLESGSVATSFEDRSIGVEVLLCQRYLPCFIANSASAIICLGYTSGTTSAVGIFTLTAPPRVPPTGLTVSSSSDFTFSNSGTFNGSAVTFGSSSNLAVTFVLTVSGATVNQPGRVHANVSTAKLFFTGCEL